MAEKRYVVVMGVETLFGPDSDYKKVKEFMDGLSPTIKGKCSVKTVAGTPAAAAASEPEPAATPPVASEPAPAAPTAPSTKPAPTPVAPSKAGNVDAAFWGAFEGSGSSATWKPKDGRNVIRILPIGGVLPTDWVTPYPFVLSGVHSNVGLSLNDTVICPRLTFGDACPICQFSWRMYESKDEGEIQTGKKIKGYIRVLANIIDLADPEKGVQKFAMGKKLATKIKTYMEDPEFAPLLDAEIGHNFILIKKTVDGFPNYDDSRPEVKRSSLSTLYPAWQKEAHALVGDIKKKSFAELQAIVQNTKRALLAASSSGGMGPDGGAGEASSAAVTDEDEDTIRGRLNKI